MASNVFGSPITDETLRGIPQYAGNASYSRKDRADVAILRKNYQGKDIQARAYVERLKQNYGQGQSALCLIYNATGDNLKLINRRDWHGRVETGPYPNLIANGQWGAFLHAHTIAAAAGSAGAIIYRGPLTATTERAWMVSWSVPHTTGNNTVFCEIREPQYFELAATWDILQNLLYNGDFISNRTKDGCYATASIAANDSPTMEAIFTLENVL